MNTNTQEKPVDEKKRDRMEAWSYGMGSLPANLNTQLKSSFHMAFLTEIAGLNSAVIGIANTVLTIWDAINDILIGTMADRTNTRMGKYRPHMLWGVITWTIITILMFLVPGFNIPGKYIYYIALLSVWSVACTAFVVPWQSLNTAMSTSPDKRNFMLMLRMLVGTVAATLMMAALPAMIEKYPGAKGYQIVVFICVGISLVGGLICIHGARHKDYKDSIPTPKKVSLKGIGKLFACKPILCVALMLGCGYLTMGIGSASNLYYFKYVVGDMTPMSISALFTMVTGLVLVPFIPKLYKVVGRMNLFLIGLALQLPLHICKIIFRESISVTLLLIVFFIFSCGFSITNMTVLSFVPDCCDWSELNLGSPNAGQISALASFMKKFMNSFSTSIIGIALAIGGYVDASTPASSSLTTAILVSSAVVPLILVVASFIAAHIFPIKGAYAKEMRAQLAEIRDQKKYEAK